MTQSGSDKAAIAWAIAKNIENNNGFENQKKAYRNGIRDGKNPNDKISESSEQPIDDFPGGTICIPIDKDDNFTGGDGAGVFDAVGNLDKGLRFDCGTNTYNGVTDEYSVIISIDRSGDGLGDLKWQLSGASQGVLSGCVLTHASGGYKIGPYPSGFVVASWELNPSAGTVTAVYNNGYRTNFIDYIYPIDMNFFYVFNIWRNTSSVATYF